MHILLVHNGEAGDAADHPEAIADHICRHGHSVISRGLNEGWCSELRQAVDVVVVAGGDRTVSTVARQLARTKIPLAVLPMGTANNVAAALDVLDLDVDQQVRRWEHGTHRCCDIGYALNARTDGRFLESVGVGLLAEVMVRAAGAPAAFIDRLVDPVRRLAAARAMTVSTLATQEPVSAELTLDGFEMSGRFLFVEVMNFGSAGPGLQLVPGADWSDGAFDVVWAEEHHRDSLLRDLTQADAGGAISTPLPMKRARQVGLTTDSRAHVDDRVVEDPFRLTLTVDRQALTFA